MDWAYVEYAGVEVRFKGDPLGPARQFELQTERFGGTDKREWRRVKTVASLDLFRLGFKAGVA